jgi:1-aminocyclopropane-1-carboxylate deaminase/D-cysteine desulfhydrase-like pyridoxal-dependent ACC family enzyme
MIPLFQHFPVLKNKLSHISLCDLPTPVFHLTRTGKNLGLDKLYMKMDGFTGKIYGGNKVRKLEFLLGEALGKKLKEVMTFGGAGSNHATATAIYAKKVGLSSISMLLPQINAEYVRKNLLLSYLYGAELRHFPNYFHLSIGKKYHCFKHWLRKGKMPYIIPMGGSSPVGIAGYVNAAFELKQQIEQNNIPEPDIIYVALGSAGTMIGLLIGIKVLNIQSRLVPVRVVPFKTANLETIKKLFTETVSFLCSLDPSFPCVKFPQDELKIRDEFFGNDYAHFTNEGIEAIKLIKELEDIRLDGTYTGKTFAALIYDAKSGNLKNKKVLFWNTLNARDFPDEIKGLDYHELPKSFHRYFEEEVQELDKHY